MPRDPCDFVKHVCVRRVSWLAESMWAVFTPC